MPEDVKRPYHHGQLPRAVIEAAIKEIDEVGPTQMSMRSIARRAGVSHGAPAHHFGDKTGIFTAIATEGYEMLEVATREACASSSSLVEVGTIYYRFALGHRSHFEVMFRPDLFDVSNEKLQGARNASFENLIKCVRDALGSSDDEVIARTAVAAWSVVHGFTTLQMNGNLDKMEEEHQHASLEEMMRGVISVGEIVSRQQEQSSG